ncbi:MAG: hypothetical protein WBD36_11070 [Bacteroidota bacterium]
MAQEQPEMKSIWYFVGVMLTVMGSLIFLSSAYDLFQSIPQKTVLAGLHPGLWWSILMVVAGIVFIGIRQKPSS